MPALPSELLESELFGDERGAFTGAFQRKPGMFELADGGTLLLDEIGDMDFKLQAKLLQVLQITSSRGWAGKETVRVDVRVIAATPNDLEAPISGGQVPPGSLLPAERGDAVRAAVAGTREDIVRLPEFLLKKHCRDPLPEITPQLQKALLAHDWPG